MVAQALVISKLDYCNELYVSFPFKIGLEDAANTECHSKAVKGVFLLTMRNTCIERSSLAADMLLGQGKDHTIVM